MPAAPLLAVGSHRVAGNVVYKDADDLKRSGIDISQMEEGEYGGEANQPQYGGSN